MLLELSVKQACELLGICRATLDKRIALGEIKTRKSEVLRAGKHGVVVLLEIDPKPQPKPTTANVTLRPLPEPTPETPEEEFARRYLANEVPDSFGNFHNGVRDEEGDLHANPQFPEFGKVTWLGPYRKPPIPAEPVHDAAWAADNARARELGISYEELPRDNHGNPLPRGMTQEAYNAGVAADRKYHSRSEQQKRAAHDRTVIAASFPKAQRT